VKKGCTILSIKALPIPAGAVEPGRDQEDDQEGDEEAEGDHGGEDGPDEGPLGEVDHGRAQGHAHPPGPLPVLGRVAGLVHALHAQGAHQARPHVTQPVEGVLAVVRAHATLAWCEGGRETKRARERERERERESERATGGLNEGWFCLLVQQSPFLHPFMCPHVVKSTGHKRSRPIKKGSEKENVM